MNTIAHHIGLLKTARNNIQRLMDSCTWEECNRIPRRFNNNLIWNYGHVLVTRQLLVYALAGVPPQVEEEFINKYRKGSRPDGPTSEQEYEHLRLLFHQTPDKTLEDFNAGVFHNFKIYKTGFNVELKNVEDAIIFNNMHEAMHLGTMLAMQKVLCKKP